MNLPLTWVRNSGFLTGYKLINRVLISLPMPRSITSGFTSMWNVPKKKANTRVLLRMDTSRFRCFHTCGIRLLMDKMRFGQPVITGSRIRLVTKLYNIQNLRGICKAEIEFKIEIEGQRKPALEGIASFLYYFI